MMKSNTYLLRTTQCLTIQESGQVKLYDYLIHLETPTNPTLDFQIHNNSSNYMAVGSWGQGGEVPPPDFGNLVLK